MSEQFLMDASVWRVEYTDDSVRPLAAQLARVAKLGAALPDEPRLQRDNRATLGTPTVILTVIATSLSKALVVAGLRMVQQDLKSYLVAKQAENLEINIDGSGSERRKRFMTEVSKESVDLLISQAIKFVESL